MPDYQFNTNLGPAQQQGTSLGDLVNTARGVQAYQQQQQLNPLALQKAQMEIEQAKQLNPLAVRKSTAETSTAETGAKKSAFGLTQDQSKVINDNIGSVLNDERLVDPNPQRRATPLLEARQKAINEGVDPVMAEMMFAPFIDKAFRDKSPTAVKDMLSGIKNVQQSGIGATGQQALQTPGVTTNAAGQLVTVNPLKNTVNVVGDQATPAGVTPQSMTRPQGAPMSANPSQAQAGLLNKATDTAAADWGQTVADANTAQGRIAIYQNIKSLTPDAFTGVGGERKKFISGVAQSIGIPAYELETSTTDELTKNAKLLSLAGGNTDAARSIAEMATPNAKMTKEAIQRVANQLIGVEKLKQAKADYLAPYLMNPAQYQEKLNEFGKFSDFRLFQEMSPEEVSSLKKSMSPAERKLMSDKIQQARTLGIIK